VKRRPSFATVVALLALFLALGGPAEAARVAKRITGADVKDHSLQARDLSRDAVRSLRTPRDASVTEVKIVNGSVTRGKLARDAVGTAALTDHSVSGSDLAFGSVTGTTIADGSLTARELGRFYGRFRLTAPIPALQPGQCWAGVPSNLPAERARVDISQDLVLVTPDASWPEKTLSITVRVEPAQPKPGRFALAACNGTGKPSEPFTPSFSYLIVDLP
jgi:hypothetical protein